MSAEDVNMTVIPNGAKGFISFCGSATYKLGIQGKVDLHRGHDSRIASLYWEAPWRRHGNRFEIKNVNTEKYTITCSPIHRNGVLGELSITVNQINF